VKLITAHRILIGAGIAFFVFYAAIVLARQHTTMGLVQAVASLAVAVLLMHDRTTASVVQAIVALAVAGGLVLYYRTLKRWGQRPPS
jgi:hypothetical protein